MTRLEFIKEFAETGNMTQKMARETLEVLQDVVFSHVAKGDDVKLFEGVVFTSADRSPRSGRNPQTGETIVIPARRVPKVKFGKAVKDLFR
jgi:DNA-binding protein HU-beta